MGSGGVCVGGGGVCVCVGGGGGGVDARDKVLSTILLSLCQKVLVEHVSQR